MIKSCHAQNDLKSIQVSTYGIFFMGTPHQGESEVCLGKLMPNAATLFEELGWLQVQLGQYAQISGCFETKLGFERYPTPIGKGEKAMVSNSLFVIGKLPTRFRLFQNLRRLHSFGNLLPCTQIMLIWSGILLERMKDTQRCQIIFH